MATRDEINAEFYAGYGDQPRGMTLMDYLNPASYRDPYQSLRNPTQAAQQVSEQVAPVANSMPNLGRLTDYIPSASTIGEYIPTRLPNIFGQENPLYAGLLGADQSQALSRQSNIAGLLGAASALVSGMGNQGPRRSAAQNIINALGAGYGAAGQGYQQGLQSYGQAQQLAMQQRQQAGVQAMKMKYPDLTDEFDTNPAGAFRIVSEREAAARKPTVVSEGGTLVSPTGEVLYASTKNKPQARMLTNQEAADANLPYKEGQKYQIDANGKLDLIQGTAPAKDNYTAKYRDYLQLKEDGYQGSYEQYLKDPSFNRPQTSVTVNTGDLSKPTKSKLEETILSSGDALTRLNTIQSSYKPEYLGIKFRGAQEWSTLKDKFGTLKPEEKAQLTSFSKYRQNATQNLNQTIKDLTGSAMGVQEAERIISTLPNAGTGIFDGDSPTQFESKLNNAVEQTKYAIARKNYSLNKGLKWENTPLSQMPNVINQRGAQIAQQYKLDPNKPADLKTINRQLAAEFGINF
jgi:hypothetical protein